MTRQAPSIPLSAEGVAQQSRAGLLRPLSRVRSRSDEIVERLAQQIIGGSLSAGAKLPSEQEMMVAMGVSRTVVREAVAALRARGLVVTRQGAGAFVSNDPRRQSYMIDPEGLGSLTSVIEVMELRMAVEAEAAAIASERASAVQLKAIRQAQKMFSKAVARGERSINEDYAFHDAIAVATQNGRFIEFLHFLGRLIIPRQSIRTFEDTDALRRYLQKVEREHQAIAEAVEARAPSKARELMRRHLLNGRERYRQLAAGKAK
jgi:GntR family transcriptional repressor for pyruvate dehydrogenase complex